MAGKILACAVLAVALISLILVRWDAGRARRVRRRPLPRRASRSAALDDLARPFSEETKRTEERATAFRRAARAGDVDAMRRALAQLDVPGVEVRRADERTEGE